MSERSKGFGRQLTSLKSGAGRALQKQLAALVVAAVHVAAPLGAWGEAA